MLHNNTFLLTPSRIEETPPIKPRHNLFHVGFVTLVAKKFGSKGFGFRRLDKE